MLAYLAPYIRASCHIMGRDLRLKHPSYMSYSLLGGSWDLVTTYNWDYNPAYNWGKPYKPIKEDYE